MRAFLLILPACIASGALAAATAPDVSGTKQPYAPRQDPATYEAPPPGFVPVQLQLVARHGARGLTGMKGELALLNLCRLAREQRALTPLGEQLAADLEALIRANALLGAGVEGVAKPGYGNLSLTGIEEHRGLARRTLARQPAVFDGAGAIVVEHSGVDRARDSAAVYTAALLQARPALAPRLQDGGANRYTLYFHKLNTKTDGGAQEGWRRDVFRASAAYQAYLDSPALAARLEAIDADPRLKPATHAVLGRLFRPAFLARLARGDVHAANTGSFDFATADGSFKTTVKGDGKTVIAGAKDALEALSDAHDIAPGLARELGGDPRRDFGTYLPPAQARLLSSLKQAEDFYEKGPGMREQDGVTWRMAGGLVAELFREAGADAPLAHLRFTHAEIMLPLAAALGLPGKSEPLPQSVPFSEQASRWRSAEVAPYTANLQWDSYRHPDGRRIVRMLWNEAETGFKPACDGARIAPGSHFYDLARLKACYGQE
ncbi:histidine-type phosphatase [Massilia phyllosphaerae]|uniref:histidine-type phosphatase n=1 Tax=Massilia phyllosphaerae TaxID=3106034 RepID=UPI002B1CBAFF|nr:histidine-type phosphatase [Massilia sp. SGZ-792]